MKVLFAASECAPIVKVGGLADVVGSLPKALAKIGLEVAVALPHYASIGPNYPPFLPGTGIPVFYLGNKGDYSGEIYPGGDQEKERFANFSRQVVNFLETRQFEAEILHLHDYHTSLIPDILHERGIKLATVLTIHDVQNQGLSDPEVLDSADLRADFLRVLDWDLRDRNIAMLLQGIVGADVINTVSPTYAKEILERSIAGDLADVLNSRQARVFGILNGIDQNFYDPRRDRQINQTFGPANFGQAKAKNKAWLQENLGLEVNPKAPLLGMVTRLVERKGVELIIQLLPSLFKRGIQLVVLGRGEPEYEAALKDWAAKNPRALAFKNAFDEPLSHQIYAGSDFFLLPSRTEPCGLTQMIACRYGSLPIAHRTGGLTDTVFDDVNGYVFESFTAEALGQTVQRAVKVAREDPPRHQKMVATAMNWDFSWEKSAPAYQKLYQRALQYSLGIARGVGGEIRQGSLGSWTILAEGRAKRPFEEKSSVASNQSSAKDELEKCPFEAGHEKMSAPEVFRIGSGEPDSSGWEVRVVANKYPLLPVHEVIIYSPDHYKDLTDLPLLWVEKVVWAYLSRYRTHEERGYVHLFCNHGQEAAASLGHPHTQLIVLDQLPEATIQALQTAQQYYEAYHHCAYCQTIDREVKSGPHFIDRNSSFLLVTPYASDWPYELTVLPFKHRQSFGDMSEAELKDLAQILQTALRLLRKKLNNPSYNYWIHSVPELIGFAKSSLFYHWHIDIVPRIKKLGGLELGASVMVDDLTSPEKAAQELRSLLSEI